MRRISTGCMKIEVGGGGGGGSGGGGGGGSDKLGTAPHSSFSRCKWVFFVFCGFNMVIGKKVCRFSLRMCAHVCSCEGEAVIYLEQPT